MIKNFFDKLSNVWRYRIQKTIGKMVREHLRSPIERKKLKNKEFTILSNNCLSGIISHDLGQRFDSPTVNLFIPPFYFVRFLENLEEYLTLDLDFTDQFHVPYPVAYLGDIPIFFIHYKTREDAKNKWEIRKGRIHRENLFVMMTDRYCCPYEVLRRFDALPYQNKICLTKYDYPEFPSCVQIEKRSDECCVGVITDIVSITGKRMYQLGFDYIKWLNGGTAKGD